MFTARAIEPQRLATAPGQETATAKPFGLKLQEALNADGVKRLLATGNLEKAFATDFTDDTD